VPVRSTGRPRIFFDTNIPSKLLAAPYLPHLSDIRHEIELRYRIVFSPETFIELMDTLKGGDGSFFEGDRKRLSITGGRGQVQFMRFPGEFALKQSLGIERPAAFGPADFKRWYKLIQRARDRSELFERGVPRGRYVITFDPSMIEVQQEAGKKTYREWLQKAVTGGYAFPPPNRWASMFAKDLGYEITPEQAAKLADDLSAAYEFRNSDFNTAASNKTYRWEKRDSDWVDGQQLIYLCDPTAHLLTDEVKIKTKCAASPQSKRVLILSEFLATILG
jgi:hypothetical protein